MRKYLICIIALAGLLFDYNVAKSAGSDFEAKVQQAIEALKSRGPVEREEFIDIDTKEVIFAHKKHQDLIKELNKSCAVCHHKWKAGKDPRACRRCHVGRRVVSKGKYARKGQQLNLKDIFHLVCNDCHKKMLADGYRRADGSPAEIPTKCYHCHTKKKE